MSATGSFVTISDQNLLAAETHPRRRASRGKLASLAEVESLARGQSSARLSQPSVVDVRRQPV